MRSNPNGWKRRQQRAQKRMAAKNSPERQAIRAARAAHYRGEAYVAPVQVAAPAALEDMSWQQLATEVRSHGVFVPPKMKEENLRDKLRGLRDEEGPAEDRASESDGVEASSASEATEA